jgi:hypothetical protein
MAKKKKLGLKKSDYFKKVLKDSELRLIREPHIEYSSEEEVLSPKAQERYKRMIYEIEEDIRLGNAKKYTDISELKSDLRAGI